MVALSLQPIYRSNLHQGSWTTTWIWEAFKHAWQKTNTCNWSLYKHSTIMDLAHLQNQRTSTCIAYFYRNFDRVPLWNNSRPGNKNNLTKFPQRNKQLPSPCKIKQTSKIPCKSKQSQACTSLLHTIKIEDPFPNSPMLCL